ncbi:putative receptor accessory protein 5-like [Homarus americanus]|uniref:Putative receptor accessory protein 5-like n=1 Tax=Homarus americanus TaxID=6706 RepID=A0A8J5K1S1_HOMAM|nr:putative receptor accessory protein 5-like [Homarus americanus]
MEDEVITQEKIPENTQNSLQEEEVMKEWLSSAADGPVNLTLRERWSSNVIRIKSQVINIRSKVTTMRRSFEGVANDDRYAMARLTGEGSGGLSEASWYCGEVCVCLTSFLLLPFKMAANLEYYKEQAVKILYQKNKLTDFLTKLESKTQVKREYIALAVITYLAFGISVPEPQVLYTTTKANLREAKWTPRILLLCLY